MRCLYCGKHLPLFRKLTSGGEFCSDAHRDKYHEEYNKLAVSRLLQAQSRPEDVKRGKKKGEPPPPPPVEAEVEVTPTIEVEPERRDFRELIIPAEAADLPESTHLAETADSPEEPTLSREPEVEVVAYVKEFQHGEVSPVAATLEWMPVDLEPAVPLHTPGFPSLPESARPRLEAGALQLHDEAGFLTSRPQAQRGNRTVIETASALIATASHALPTRPDSEIGKGGLREADAITRGSLPIGYRNQFEPLAVGITAVDFVNPKTVVGTSSSTPVTHDLSKAGLIGLALATLRPDDGTLDIETIATFRYLIELTPAFETSLSLLDRAAEEGSDLASVETFKSPAVAVNGNGTEKSEPLDVTPRHVLEVLSRLQGDSRQPENGEPQPGAASSLPCHCVRKWRSAMLQGQ